MDERIKKESMRKIMNLAAMLRHLSLELIRF